MSRLKLGVLVKTDQSNVYLPITETISTEFIPKNKKSVLMTGDYGVGKTIYLGNG